MIKTTCFSFLYCACLLLQSCDSNQRKVETIFNKVENIVEQYPDSALLLLDFIPNPYELNKAQYAQYILLSVQAKDKAYKDIAADTLIFRAKDYFKKKNDIRNLALSKFYCGRVLQSQKKTDEAMKIYLEVEDMAEKANDVPLRGLAEFFIGELNYEHYLFDEAIVHYKNSVSHFSHSKDKYKSQIASYSCIGNSFLVNDLSDSAFVYYKKGLALSEQCGDSVLKINIIQNMGVAYLELGYPDQAKMLLSEALPYCADKINKAKIYKCLAKVSFQENKKDSALYYSNLALEMSKGDTDFHVGLYNLLSQIKESTGDYRESLEYHKQYVEDLSLAFEASDSSNILMIQKKYDFELLQNANKELLIQRLWILITFMLTVGIAFFTIYRNHKLNKEGLLTARQQIYQLREMTNKKSEDNSHNSVDETNNEANYKLRDALFKQLNMFKKLSLLERYLGDEEIRKGRKILEKVNEIIYNSKDTFNWEIFYQSVNALYGDFLVRLTGLYPALDEEDILICCLSKIGLDNTEIALLVKSNQNIVQKKKSSIREKTGMKKQENFVKQLYEIVKNNTDI